MGRHRASGSAAASSTLSMPAATVRIVGYAGSLALALGIGAAVAGSTPIAAAEGSTDGAGGNAAGKPSPTSPAGERTANRAKGTRSADVKVRTSRPTGGPKVERAGKRIASPPAQRATHDAPAGERRPSVWQAGGRHSAPHPFVRRLTDAAAAAIRGDVQPPRAAPSPTTPPPLPLLAGALQLVRRELEQISVNHDSLKAALTSTTADPAIAATAPDPDDQAPTAYGDIGKWMLQSDGQISNWGGQPHDGKTLIEPVNVIIVDPTSTSPEQAGAKLNVAMLLAGFPAQPIHSGGFEGAIDNVAYGQRPILPLLGYSDNFFLLPNNHGRIFGPDPVETSAGYVWTGAFSTEEFAFYELLPVHAYVSSNTARTALAMRLILSGQATYGGMVPLDNSYNTDTITTGDHDGYAVVIVLR